MGLSAIRCLSIHAIDINRSSQGTPSSDFERQCSLLGLDGSRTDITKQEVKAAFRRAAMIHHPDKVGGGGDCVYYHVYVVFHAYIIFISMYIMFLMPS
jgi:hypothetical protein